VISRLCGRLQDRVVDVARTEVGEDGVEVVLEDRGVVRLVLPTEWKGVLGKNR